MNYLDFNKSCCQMMIKHLKTAVKINQYALYANVLLCLINGYIVYKDHAFFNAICLGGIIVVSMYCFVEWRMNKDDLKLEKLKLKRIEEAQDDEVMKEIIEEHRNSKNYYDELVKILKEKNPNAFYPESTPLESM